MANAVRLVELSMSLELAKEVAFQINSARSETPARDVSRLMPLGFPDLAPIEPPSGDEDDDPASLGPASIDSVNERIVDINNNLQALQSMLNSVIAVLNPNG